MLSIILKMYSILVSVTFSHFIIVGLSQVSVVCFIFILSKHSEAAAAFVRSPRTSVQCVWT